MYVSAGITVWVDEGEKFDVGAVGNHNGTAAAAAGGQEPKSEAKELEEALQRIAQMEMGEKAAALHRKQKDEYLKEGENVYELFSVTVHVGGAFGGHYYVYIRSSEDGKWYCFNDSTVSTASEADVIRTFGDLEGAKCAYMLMYRKAGVPPVQVLTEDIPKYLRDLIEQERAEETKEIERLKEEERKVRISVFFGKELYLVPMLKDDTVLKLKEVVIERFKVKADIKNCRLRAYSRREGRMLEPVPPEHDALTLAKANVSTYRDYALEVKEEKAKFEEFAEDDTSLLLVFYSPTFACLDEDKLPVQNMRVKRAWKLKDVFAQIARELGTSLSHEKLRIFKRRNGETYQQTTFESVFFEENMEKLPKDVGIYDGARLYVERIESEEDLKRSLWISALEEDKAKLYVQFNNPYKAGPDDYNVEYEQQLDVNRNITLAELKKKIAENLSLKEDEFILKRGGKASPELKEMLATLGSLGLLRNSTIYVEFGKPSRPDEYKTTFAEAITSSNEENDTESHEFIDLGEMPVEANATVLQVKSAICQYLAKERSWTLTPGRIRLRERCGDKLGRVFQDAFDMKYYSLYDGKQIAFQILDEEEYLGLDEVVIVAREWNPTDWSLSDPKELVVKKTWRLHDLSYHICDQFPEYRSKISQLMIGKVSSLWNFRRGDLLGMRVHNFFTNRGSGSRSI